MPIRYAARTPEQLANREVQATKVGAWATSLVAVYETDPELVASVLPPPLEPRADAHVKVTIATVDLGRPGLAPFGAGSFSVAARHEGTDGWYALVMPMTTEQSVIGGRETFGEPKKLGQVELHRDGDRVVGTVARLGTTIIEIAGTIGEPVEVSDGRRTDFYFKFLPAPDGKGFDDEASLVYCHRDESTRSARAVDGQVLLRDSRFDPVADLPVQKLVSITLAERNSTQTGEIVSRVPAEWLIPYAHQRYDDLSPVNDANAR
jgi:acetoacetate decarboxylase